MTNYNSYVELIDKHIGRNAFVLAAGPSLFFNMKQSIFSILSKYGIVITVNSAVISYSNFNYWISNDSLCRNWSWWKLVENGKGRKVVRNSWKPFRKQLKNFLYFKPRPTSEGIINPDDIGLCYCSSTTSAIDLVLQCGCKKIFVLGLDHCAVNGKDHFWQFFPRIEQPRQLRPAQGLFSQQKSLFPIHLKAYKALKKFAKHKEAKIYNCNVDSKVEIFKKIEFRNIKKYVG